MVGDHITPMLAECSSSDPGFFGGGLESLEPRVLLAVVVDYGPFTDLAAGVDPRWVTTADLDGINGPDLIAVNAGQAAPMDPYTISVLLNDGTGSFVAATNQNVGDTPFQAAVGNFNHTVDSHVDVAVINSGSNNVTILFNDGTGSFTVGGPYATGDDPEGDGPQCIAVADLDGDTHLDIAVGNGASDPPTVGILWNDGTGGFATKSMVSVGRNPLGIAIADLNGANGPDLVVANQADNTVSILLNDGPGTRTFTAGTGVATDQSPIGVALGDLDGTNGPDLVVANSMASPASASVYQNNGAGVFSAWQTLNTGNLPMATTLADLDGDTDLDLLVANQGSDNVSVFLNNGVSPFVPNATPTFATGDNPLSIALADFDQDGDLDMANGHTGTGPGPDAGDGVAVLMSTAVPAAPTNLAATDGTHAAHVALTWDAVPSVDDYGVYRNTINDPGTAAKIHDEPTTSYDDTTAAPGTLYYYWVRAQNALGDSDLSTGDSGHRDWFQQVGTTLDVWGTDAVRDEFNFAAGATYTVNLNGDARAYAPAALSLIRFWGQGDSDTAALAGDASRDSLTLSGGGTGTLQGTGYTVNISSVETQRGYGSSDDTAYLYDAATNDNLTARETFTTYTGVGFALSVQGFGTVRAYATGGGTNYASMFDSGGNDNFYGRASYSYMRFQTANTNWATGFTRVYAYATGGGIDYATLHDSSGDDWFVSGPDFAYLNGPGVYNRAAGFDRVYANATTGTDRAYLYDSGADDSFVGCSSFAYLSGTGFYDRVAAFDYVYGRATAGGTDKAYLYDSPGDDTFAAKETYSVIYAAGYSCFAEGFDNVYGYAPGAGTDYAILYDSAGNDTFVGKETFSYLSLAGGGVYAATGFDRVYGVASNGGSDTATLFDSAGNDVFLATVGYGYLSGTGFYNYAKYFDSVYAVASTGTDDVHYYDSPGDDLFTGWGDYARLTGVGYFHQAEAFDTVTANGTAGGVNTMALTLPLGYALIQNGTWV